MKKALILEKPPITSYPEIANPFSILWCHKEKTMPWIADRFVQLMMAKDDEDVWNTHFYDAYHPSFYMPLAFCPFISPCRIDRKMIDSSYRNFCEFLETAINNNKYVDIMLDWYYISESSLYLKEHLVHDTMINGYDSDKKIFYVSDFYKYHYQRAILSYDEILNSYTSDCVSIWGQEAMSAHLYEYIDIDYELNLDLLKLTLNDYLTGDDNLRGLKYYVDVFFRARELTFGVNCYDLLVEDLNNHSYCNMKAFHTLYDHKRLMKHRIEYLYSIGFISNKQQFLLLEKCNLLIQESLLARNMFLKMSISNNRTMLDKICKKLEYIKTQDIVFVKELLACL